MPSSALKINNLISLKGIIDETTVNKFLIDFPQIILLDGNTSFLQLADEGLDYVFTCHGTVGHEVPLLGIQVINADINNPHICYDFNWNPKKYN